MWYTYENAGERPILGVGGRVAWTGLALSYILMLRATELFAWENGDFHIIYCLRKGDVVFFRNNEQSGEGGRQEADKVCLLYTSPSPRD